MKEIEEYKGFKIMLDEKTGKFNAEKDGIEISDEKLKELKRKIDKITFKRERGFFYVGWIGKILECEKTSEVDKGGLVGKIHRVSYKDEEDGKKRWMEVKYFAKYSDKIAKLVEQHNKNVDKIQELERENIKLRRKIFKGVD